MRSKNLNYSTGQAPRRIKELFYGVRFNIMRGVKLLAI